MGFLFSSKKKKMVAIFDIGSGSVGGALVYMPTEGELLPTIIKSTRTNIINRAEVNFNLFLEDMILALGATSRNLYQSKLGAPDEIVCVLASPWYISETRTIKMSKNHSFTFTKKIVDELLKKEITSLTNVYKNKYGEIESLPLVVESPIVGISLDGLRVSNPIGGQARSIEMNMIVTLSPKLCLDKIKESVSRNFHHTPISFSSFMVASYVSIRDKYINSGPYLLLDVGGEVTDIGIVLNDILMGSVSFPYGKETLFRNMCKELKIELRDARELFNLYSQGNLSDQKIAKVISALESAKISWGKSFKEGVDVLSQNCMLPNLLFLTIDADVKDFFVKIINNEKYIKSLTKTTVVPLDGSLFLDMCNVKNGICDPFLMIESISVMRKMGKYE